MARKKNDGRGRMGGRAKGTPNKVTGSVKEWLAELINSNRLQMEQDIKQLQPRERLQMLERFMQYVVPKTPISIEQTTPVPMGKRVIRIGGLNKKQDEEYLRNNPDEVRIGFNDEDD